MPRLGDTTVPLVTDDGKALTPAARAQAAGIRRLSLQGQLVGRFHPDLFAELTGLGMRHLDLSSNNLTSLPDGLFDLTDLQELDLSGNWLVELPDAIGRLTNLVILRLSSNQLRELPATIGELHQLRLLETNNNRLTALPPAITGLAALELFELTDNTLTTLPAGVAGPDSPRCPLRVTSCAPFPPSSPAWARWSTSASRGTGSPRCPPT
jgi:hypothetical protein